MLVPDPEIELLEAFIDGHLPAAEADALRRRLPAEPPLAAALEALRAERQLRDQLFESMEPDDRSVERLMSGVRREIRREIVVGERMRIFRYVGAAAACVLVSFFAGWAERGQFANHGVAAPGVENNTQMVSASDPASHSGSIDFRGSAPTSLVSNTSAPRAGGTRRPGGYQVALSDALGRVVAVQHFDTLEEAREFTEDVGRWQKQQQQIHNADTVLIKDEF